MSILNLFSMTKNDGLTRLDSRLFCMAEHLFTTCQCKLIHQFYLLGLLGVVFDFCLDENRIACCIVPDMYAKRFDTHSIGLNQTYRTEDTKRLTTFTKAVF